MPPANSITEKTRLPLSLVLLIVLASASGVGLFAAIRQDVAELRRTASQSLPREEFKDWSHRLERLNNFLDVPDLGARSERAATPHPVSAPMMGKTRP
jgi:hypothetical protein